MGEQGHLEQARPPPERGEQFLSAMVTDDSSQWSRLKRVDGEEEEKQTHLLRLHT